MALGGRSLRTAEEILSIPRPWVLVALVAAVLLASACAAGETIPVLERRAQELNQTIMCPVCPGESIDQSQNPLAVQMRGIVDDRLAAGWTEQQITEFFVERYGPSVLLEPPRRGFNLLAWLLPPVGVAGAALALLFTMRVMTSRRPPEERGALAGLRLSEAERQTYFGRIDAALGAEPGPEPAPADDGSSAQKDGRAG